MEWLVSYDLLRAWDTSEAYLQCEVGLRTINPLKIVGLSRPFHDIFDDARMECLKERVALHGWIDDERDSPHICLLPDFKLVVCQNGNHRTILARELGIQRMRVDLLVMVPRCQISVWLLKKYLACISEWDQCIEGFWNADNRGDEKTRKIMDRAIRRLESRSRSMSAYIGKQYLEGINLL
ncbi:hypothetical protein [Alicyclobacillus fastidiosus]|uniref:ParB/Sulfiredoxin domain-containing protein n=1 Tax=Alicyclobacillus fastidiosus TaxID=392011 RepID=A0ABV5AKY7_9BACL